jgi:hypothetical protein
MKLLIGALCVVLLYLNRLRAGPITVRHIEGTGSGFLVIRNLDGTAIAYGQLEQVVRGEEVTDDLPCRFKDGSFYEEITKSRQAREFRLLSDKVT